MESKDLLLCLQKLIEPKDSLLCSQKLASYSQFRVRWIQIAPSHFIYSRSISIQVVTSFKYSNSVCIFHLPCACHLILLDLGLLILFVKLLFMRCLIVQFSPASCCMLLNPDTYLNAVSSNTVSLSFLPPLQNESRNFISIENNKKS